MLFWVLGGLVILGIIILLVSNALIVPSEHTVFLQGLPKEMDGIRILHLSDLHSSRYGKGQRRLAQKIRKLHPDCILCTGDMMDKYTGNGDPFLQLLQTLKQDCPIIASIGNHELRVQKKDNQSYRDFVNHAQNSGVQFVDNGKTVLPYKGAELDVYGLTLPLPVFYEHQQPEPVSVYLGVREKAPCILLAHDPRWLEQYAGWGAGLVLSGHIHGGIVRLPLIGGLFSPARTLLPKYDAGLFRQGDTQMYVTRGIGESGKRRIFSFPELAVLTLRRKGEADETE